MMAYKEDETFITECGQDLYKDLATHSLPRSAWYGETRECGQDLYKDRLISGEGGIVFLSDCRD